MGALISKTSDMKRNLPLPPSGSGLLISRGARGQNHQSVGCRVTCVVPLQSVHMCSSSSLSTWVRNIKRKEKKGNKGRKKKRGQVQVGALPHNRPASIDLINNTAYLPMQVMCIPGRPYQGTKLHTYNSIRSILRTYERSPDLAFCAPFLPGRIWNSKVVPRTRDMYPIA